MCLGAEQRKEITKRHDWTEDIQLFETCPRCNGEGIFVRNRKETSCHKCGGEGVLYVERKGKRRENQSDQ